MNLCECFSRHEELWSRQGGGLWYRVAMSHMHFSHKESGDALLA